MLKNENFLVEQFASNPSTSKERDALIQQALAEDKHYQQERPRRGNKLRADFSLEEDFKEQGIFIEEGQVERINGSAERAEDAYEALLEWAKTAKIYSTSYNWQTNQDEYTLSYEEEARNRVFDKCAELMRGASKGEDRVLSYAFYKQIPLADVQKDGFDEVRKTLEVRGIIGHALKRHTNTHSVEVRNLEHFQPKNEQEIWNFLDVWEEVALKERPFGSSKNPVSYNVFKAANAMPGAPAWVMEQAVRSGYIKHDRKGNNADMADAARAWKHNPAMWRKEATRIGQMEPWKRIVAAGIIDKMAERFGVSISHNTERFQSAVQYQDFEEGKVPEWHQNRELRLEFWKELQQALAKGKERALLEHASEHSKNIQRLLSYEGLADDLSKEEYNAFVEHGTLRCVVEGNLPLWKQLYQSNRANDTRANDTNRRLYYDYEAAETATYIATGFPKEIAFLKTQNPWQQLVGVEIMKNIPLHGNNIGAAQTDFAQQYNHACALGKWAAISRYVPDNECNRAFVLDKILFTDGQQSAEERRAMIGSASINSMIGMKLRAWREAYAAMRRNTDSDDYDQNAAHAATAMATIFGNEWKQWLKEQKKRGQDAHDATHWLPTDFSPREMEGCGKFLFKFKDKDHSELSVIVKNWPSLSNEIKNNSYKAILADAKSRKYPNQQDLGFAVEAAKWGVSEDKYQRFEGIYLKGRQVPEPFDSSKTYEADGLTARFLPREDPRVGFFGHYTNCCQHFEGVGSACAISTVSDPFSQLFVVEDEKGEIIAGSWVWKTQNTLEDPSKPSEKSSYNVVCFDNVEAKGLGGRQDKVADLYQMAGDDIAQSQDVRKVTIGKGLSDLSLHQWNTTDNLTLPSQYSGYSDSRSQVLLSENIAAHPVTKEDQKVWVRGATESDLENAQAIASLVYPSGYQHVSYPDSGDPRGLVLMHERAGMVGYAVWSEESREIIDLAVHPEYRWCSQNLLRATMAHCRESGGEWTADMREDSSYRLMKIYDRRGEVQITEDRGVTNDLGNGDYTYGITFTVPENPVIRRGIRRGNPLSSPEEPHLNNAQEPEEPIFDINSQYEAMIMNQQIAVRS